MMAWEEIRKIDAEIEQAKKHKTPKALQQEKAKRSEEGAKQEKAKTFQRKVERAANRVAAQDPKEDPVQIEPGECYLSSQRRRGVKPLCIGER